MHPWVSVTILQDLRRCAVESADAVFIFANKFTTSDNDEDARNIVRALAVKRYVARALLWCDVVDVPHHGAFSPF